ncbi:acyl-CoA dehydrogenase family protein [Actinomadura algeriensis]|uniref:Alkylation response protein AidB-like acyl-CoA dehydrogenase n=1 Tax=Actinomadura algeriensis TaxID=1679523 RepID=A0ABR9K398_9ACTN|nr:acyl-CoA dehydrogenase family protein [Actinomadura algeriensis]MBE1536820.1 alkylation response protein AidB-like acyl-CoA dehydrogenase [Actinomadura algeriensis]
MKLASTEQTGFAESVAALLRKRDPLERMRHAPGPREFDAGLWAELVANGLLEPAEAGDVVTACLVAEALGRAAAPLPFLSASVAGALIGPAGGEVAGLATYGLSAEDGTWSAPALEIRDGLVHGTLPFVPDGDVADVVVAAVRAPDGHRLVLVRTGDTTVEPLESLDATQPLVRVVCGGSPATVLPAGGDTLASVIEEARLLALALHDATLLGLATWLLDTTVEYAGRRVQFGMPIAARQAVKHRCADMLIKVESIRSMVLELAAALESGAGDRALVAATATAWTTEAAEEVAGGALQLHGGIGFTWEHDLHHYFKRCTVGALLLGTAAHHRARVAAALTG